MTKKEKTLAQLMEELKGNFDKAKETASNSKDPRFLTVQDGNTKVRILPPQAGHIHPWVSKHIHAFNSAATGELIIVDCPFSYKEPCKICNNNGELWNSGDEASKKLASKYKRKPSYAVNALVKESKVPGEVGEVKIYRFGKKVHEKLVNALGIHGMFYAPDNSGSDFVIVKKQVGNGSGGNWANYDDSAFVGGQPLAEDVDAIMDILSQAHDLEEFKATIPENDPDLGKLFRKHILADCEAQEEEDTGYGDVPEDEPKEDDPEDTSDEPAESSDDDEDEEFMRKLKEELNN